MAARADGLPLQRPLGGVVPRREARPLPVHGARLDRSVPHLEARPQEAPGGRPGPDHRPADRLADPRRGDRGFRCGDGGGIASSVRRQSHHLRKSLAGRRRASARALQLLVRALPALLRRLQGRDRRAALCREARLRRPLPAAGASDRHHRAQGKEQRRRRAAGRCRQPLGDRREGGRAQGVESGAGHASRISTQLVKAATTKDIEIALDVAFQCSPDHPYVKSHPEWFRWRPDGTVQYAENPPKKYQDIYPFEFESEAWKSAVGRAGERVRVLDRARA